MNERQDATPPDRSGEPQAPADADDQVARAIPGADRAALGLTPPAGLEPSTASVDPTSTETPAAFDQQSALRESKPWSTSLAYQSPQVGVDADTTGEEEGHVGRAQGEDVPPGQP